MNQFVDFLTALGFTSPRQTTNRDAIELVVHDALKAVRKKLRGHRMKFLVINSATTRNSTVHEYYAVQDRNVVGRVRVESFATHSVVQLLNIEEEKK